MIKLAAADTKPDLQQILVKRKRKIEDSVRLAKAAEKRRKKMMKVQLESQASPPILLRHPLQSTLCPSLAALSPDGLEGKEISSPESGKIDNHFMVMDQNDEFVSCWLFATPFQTCSQLID